MTNNSQSTDLNESTNEGTSPLNKDKLKQYGQKSLTPFVNLLHKYKDKFDPYIVAIDKGLKGASTSLATTSANEQEKVVEGWFTEAGLWFSNVREKLKAEDSKALLSYLEEQSKTRPLLMFAISFESGLIVGRLGRYLKNLKSESTLQSSYQH